MCLFLCVLLCFCINVCTVHWHRKHQRTANCLINGLCQRDVFRCPLLSSAVGKFLHLQVYFPFRGKGFYILFCFYVLENVSTRKHKVHTDTAFFLLMHVNEINRILIIVAHSKVLTRIIGSYRVVLIIRLVFT